MLLFHGVPYFLGSFAKIIAFKMHCFKSFANVGSITLSVLWREKKYKRIISSDEQWDKETKEPYKLSANATLRLRCMFYFYFIHSGLCVLAQDKNIHTHTHTSARALSTVLHHHTSSSLAFRTLPQMQKSESNKQCQEAYFTHLLLYVTIRGARSSFFYISNSCYFLLPMTHKIDTILLYVIKNAFVQKRVNRLYVVCWVSEWVSVLPTLPFQI